MPLRQSLLARLFPARACPWIAGLLILVAACLHTGYMLSGSKLDLAPDEAHYWDWSRNLDWSYYSKGPLVAWLIRLSCELFGSLSEQLTGNLTFAIRLPAILCGSLLLVSLYVLTMQIFGRPRLALGVVASALTLPLITAGSTLMTIDSPYTCCWGWALVFAHRAVAGRNDWAWEATGVCVGLGILAKYTMVLFIPSLALFMLTSPNYRKQILSAGFGSLVGLAMLCCVPILIWNAQHDWVTFHHVFQLAGLAPKSAAPTTSTGFDWKGPLIMVGGQAGLLLGYWFVIWVCAMVAHDPLRERDPGKRYLWWMSAPMFLLFFAFSFKTSGGELNWPVTAYLSGGILAGYWLMEQFHSPSLLYRLTGWFLLSFTLLLGLTLSVLTHRSDLIHPLLESAAGPVTVDNPYPIRRFDPTCRLRGWRYLAAQVDMVRERLENHGVDPVIVGGNWTLPGELGVYCAGHPKVYCAGRAGGERYSQYDMWFNPIDHPESFLGKTFILVGNVQPRVLQAFSHVEPPILLTYKENGRPLAGWCVRVCKGFKGFGDVGKAGH